MHEHHFKNAYRNYDGGGYGEADNSASGTLTVTARVSGEASRYAMPSPSVSDFVYAALLYHGESTENETFVQGEVDGNKLTFSFQRPENTSGTFTLEVFAFNASTTIFTKDDALLSGKKTGLKVNGDKIEVVETIALEVNEKSEAPGTVSLKVTVPAGCSLSIDDMANFAITGTSPNFTVKQRSARGISAGTYSVDFTVKKSGVTVHIFTESINVLPGLCTDTWWNGNVSSEINDVAQILSKTLYVRGAGGWYATSDYNATAAANDDTNLGSFLAPFATIQKAVDTIIARNDGTSPYTIYVDGTLDGMTAAYLGENGMADFSKLTKDLNLTITTLSGTATLDGGARLDANGNVINAGIEKRVIYAKPTSGKLNLMLTNLTITGGKLASENGAGIYFESPGGTLTMNGGEISGNIGDDEVRGGGAYVGSGKFIMDEVAVSGNSTGRGAGIYVDTGGTVEMNGGTISNNNAIRAGGGFGGGVYVCAGEFTMNNGTIERNTATLNGGGVSIGSGGKFTMKGDTSKISDNTATDSGGGVCIAASGGTFKMEGGTISGNEAAHGGGVCNNDTFTMSGSASIPAGNDGKNDVYLAEGKTICVTDELDAASSPVATITLPASAYVAGTQVLSAGGTAVTQAVCDKFKLTPDPNGVDWKVAPDGTGGANGVLATTTIYAASTGNDTTGDGTKAKPFATIQKAVDTVIAQNDGTSAYTIYIDGTLDGTTAAYTGANGMADFSALTKKLNLTMKALSGTATLDGGARFDADGNAINEGIKKSVIYTYGSFKLDKFLNLTLENLVITGGNTTNNGGGIDFNRAGTLTMKGCTISRNKADCGGGINLGQADTLIMEGCTVSKNIAKNSNGYGGGVRVVAGTFIMNSGEITGNEAKEGGGVYVFDTASSSFTINGGTISGNTATSGKNGVYIGNGATYSKNGGTVQND